MAFCNPKMHDAALTPGRPECAAVRLFVWFRGSRPRAETRKIARTQIRLSRRRHGPWRLKWVGFRFGGTVRRGW